MSCFGLKRDCVKHRKRDEHQNEEPINSHVNDFQVALQERVKQIQKEGEERRRAALQRLSNATAPMEGRSGLPIYLNNGRVIGRP